ncbi:MAG: hypothetical protein A2261_02255 [Candidatus Magasanikbacteria bacterium RIFOXYA2_FULL_44_8]|uniref:Uncharacterized protein n=1 Tax=Candidatus Magasanikbacteria bacterium RIFOXYA2_FULL_44_8 TaxID=1798696 RepID=A0A1F6NK40_9BACT|nr:MAG: hypothetical protein A2261_02255 [Candidatus Magasanikbacteria bacterium RIFOXYA2_FULL_44_8]
MTAFVKLNMGITLCQVKSPFRLILAKIYFIPIQSYTSYPQRGDPHDHQPLDKNPILCYYNLSFGLNDVHFLPYKMGYKPGGGAMTWYLLHTALVSFFYYGLAMVMAAVEVESEGEFGWAHKAPTWYRTTGWVAKVYGIIMGGKPLTGYHTFMFALPLFIFHIQFAMGLEWTLANELMAMAAYFLVCPLWDFLWFVLNPHYGFARFHRENVWWHAKSTWIGCIPMDYIVGLTTSILCAVGATLVSGNQNFVADHVGVVILTLFFIVPMTITDIAPFYHRWYWRMRQTDDRDKVKMFYNPPDKPLGKE